MKPLILPPLEKCVASALKHNDARLAHRRQRLENPTELIALRHGNTI